MKRRKREKPLIAIETELNEMNTPFPLYIYKKKTSTTLIFLVLPIYLYSLFLSFVLSVFLFVLSIRGSYLFFFFYKKKKKEKNGGRRKLWGGGVFFLKPLDSL